MKVWRQEGPLADSPGVQELALSEKIKPAIAQLIISRVGDNLEQIESYLRPNLKNMHSPEGMAGLGEAVPRMIQALTQGQRIFIHGDYDVDGVCSTVLFQTVLQKMGGEVFSFVPERDLDQYGVSRRGIDRALELGCKLFVTCDCGISAHASVEYARSKGLEVIITDHHLPGENLPQALAIVNPQLSECPYGFKSLCGTGVVFLFLVALRTALKETGYFAEKGLGYPDLREDLDLVALATLADAMPLLEDNRIFTRYGLGQLGITQRPGIKALKEVTQLPDRRLTAFDVVYKLVPRINAAGRLGKAHQALALLLAQDMAEARRLAGEIDVLNQERKAIGERIHLEALDWVKGQDLDSLPALVLSDTDWHPGVLGIVAARLGEGFNRPAAVIAWGEDGQGVGSVRSVPGINVVEALKSCQSHLIRFGGHAQAAGLTLKQENFEVFQKNFLKYIAATYGSQERPNDLIYDSDLDLGHLDRDFLNQLDLLEPFGQANPEPVFAAFSVNCQEARILKKNALKLKCQTSQGSQDAIGFGLGGQCPRQGERIDLLFTPRWNEFRSTRRIQLNLKDLRTREG